MILSYRAILRGTLAATAAAALAACAHHGPPPLADTGPPPPPPAAPPPEGAPYGGVQSQPVGAVPGSVQDFVVSAGDRVYFDTNESTLTPEGRRILDMQAQWLQRYPQVMIRIEGNCDDRGTREFNLALGGRRAEQVKDYLAGQGVSGSRIATISYGKERPIDPGDGEEAWAHNRNAHTSLTAGVVGGGDAGQ